LHFSIFARAFLTLFERTVVAQIIATGEKRFLYFPVVLGTVCPCESSPNLRKTLGKVALVAAVGRLVIAFFNTEILLHNNAVGSIVGGSISLSMP
jgi:hypothetical protein